MKSLMTRVKTFSFRFLDDGVGNMKRSVTLLSEYDRPMLPPSFLTPSYIVCLCSRIEIDHQKLWGAFVCVCVYV